MSAGHGKGRGTKARNRGRMMTSPMMTTVVEGDAPVREIRSKGSRGKHPIVPGSTVKSLCWCGKRSVDVKIEDVSQGHTESCGRKGCEGGGA